MIETSSRPGAVCRGATSSPLDSHSKLLGSASACADAGGGPAATVNVIVAKAAISTAVNRDRILNHFFISDLSAGDGARICERTR
ncbi:hypothetical protein [Streptomyces sp. TRM70350]|uniref:hypothetical protein n=1 Tax=Streptomyces sp. TRM70350 TaxID=2856165 RepID=UPI001C47B97B|nr:hypothetical protein [Streptomyces sp. TRM70350]MBV7699927.1 hypothetical protein [Streptomyces sp. TRM70350]